jgi:hypothetical protein
MEFNPQFTSLWNTLFPSKDNEAAKRRLRRHIVPYVEEADDAANKVSRRRENGVRANPFL